MTPAHRAPSCHLLRRNLRRRCCVCLMLLHLTPLLLAGNPVLVDSGEKIGFTLVVESPVLSLHEPVVATFRLQNGWSRPYAFDLGEDCRSNIELTVTFPDGSRHDFRMPRTPEGGSNSECIVVVSPKSTYERQLLLSEWFQPELLGIYKVLVRVGDRAATTSLEASIIYLVEPPNRDRLRQRCEQLATTALSPRAQEASDASAALGFAIDEVCITSLDQVLKRSYHGKEDAIVGLSRLGTQEAIEVLVGAWRDLYPAQRSLAVSELRDHGHLDAFDAALYKAGLSRPK
jgi:hypothetical protein